MQIWKYLCIISKCTRCWSIRCWHPVTSSTGCQHLILQRERGIKIFVVFIQSPNLSYGFYWLHLLKSWLVNDFHKLDMITCKLIFKYIFKLIFMPLHYLHKTKVRPPIEFLNLGVANPLITQMLLSDNFLWIPNL